MIENPGRRQLLGEVPRGGLEDVDLAVRAAGAAFPIWSRLPPRERGRALLAIADVLEARQDEMAQLIANLTCHLACLQEPGLASALFDRRARSAGS